MKRKILVLLAVAAGAFGLGFGVLAAAYPGAGMYGRAEYRGYFSNQYDTQGKYVLTASCSGAYNYYNGQDNCNAFPNTINTASEFTSFVIGKLSSSTVTDRVGAAVIIQTMIGSARNNPPTAAQQQEFINRVNAVAPYTLWGTTSYTYNLNSYNQRGNDGVGPNDVAYYDDAQSGHRTFLFRNSGGQNLYAIKTRCANPVSFNAQPPGLPDDQNFNMGGTSGVDDTTVSPGQTINFTHTLAHASGTTGTSPTTIGWTTQSASSPSGPWTTVTTGNAGTFGVGVSKPDIGNQAVTVPNSSPGTQICRRISWTPDTQAGGTEASTPACATIQHDYALTSSINAVITSGGVPITGNVAEPGDTITFTYAVNNTGSTDSQTITCTYRQQTHAGYNETAPTTVFTPGGANCPPARVFPTGSTTTATEANVPAASANTTICRSFTITPVSISGGSHTSQACVLVAAKPYARVWGGDVSAGNGLTDSSGVCTQNNDAAVVGWNKRPAGNSAGAGVQYAAYALARINDFASGLHVPSGAPAPNGLSFANTTGNATNGDFGGSFGYTPCIPDYYATRPATVSAIPATVAAMTSGVYGGSGNITLGGGSIVNPNNRITVYVDGNVMITGNITYAGSWNVGSVPLFELIVRGNIYIDNDVTQLDGVYVAQASTATNGVIHTCATVGNGFADLPTNMLYTDCDTKLTVNGLFTARQIRLLRTIGTLSQSNASEPSTSANVAETFNYSPALWIAQPARQNEGATPDYDAIISLPPIL